MFKKIASIILAAMMVSATAVVASAAETEETAAAADDSVVAAADDSTVAAADDSGSTVGAGNKVYFKLDPSVWKSAKQVTCYVGTHNGGDAPFAWGSKKGNCEDEGDNLWSYDFEDKGISIESGKQYSLNFTGDWGVQTCDMLFDSSTFKWLTRKIRDGCQPVWPFKRLMLQATEKDPKQGGPLGP